MLFHSSSLLESSYKFIGLSNAVAYSDCLRGGGKKKIKGHHMYAVGHQHSESHDVGTQRSHFIHWKVTLEATLSFFIY